MTAIPQHLQALTSANTRRIGVAEFRRHIDSLGAHHGALAVADAIATKNDDPVIGSVRIGHLLRSIKWFGPQKCERCMLTSGVQNGDKRLRDLTERQIGAIVLQLEIWAERWSA